MKKLLAVLCFGIFAFSASAQEFGGNEVVRIERIEANAPLSFPTPEWAMQKFELREVDFLNTDQPREVDLVMMMQKEKMEKQRGIVEMDSPFSNSFKKEKGFIQVTNQVQFHNRGSNFDIYTGEKKIPAYQEMRAGLFNSHYSPYTRGRYYSPYSPFLR